jgi:hypothetical protein
MVSPVRRLPLVAAVLGALLLGPPAWAEDLTEEEQEEVDAFVMGNAAFFLLHEFGHALISELDLPVLGREEDAVDALATVLLVPEEDNPEDDQIIIDAMDGWFMSADTLDEEELALWDEHGLDGQRAYQMACLIYGSNPEAFTDLADAVDLPEERRETCRDEWARTEASWYQILAPHVIDDGEAGAKIKVVHRRSKGSLGEVAALLKETEVLEAFATDVMGLFRLPRPITVVAMSCGEANAYWDPDTAEMVICHELLEFQRELIVQDIEYRSH